MTYLEITLRADAANRSAAAGAYQQYRQPFLEAVPNATSKELLVRRRTCGCSTASRPRRTKAYLASELFTRDVVGGLAPLLTTTPDVRACTTPPEPRRLR